jgi:hypothetical protein
MITRALSNIGKLFRNLILKALRINYIKNMDLFIVGWAYALVSLVYGTVLLSKKQLPLGIFYITCALVMFVVLSYIGRTVGILKPKTIELIDIKITLDTPSTLLLAGLIKQSLKYKGDQAIILTEQGEKTVKDIAANLETLALNHLQQSKEALK